MANVKNRQRQSKKKDRRRKIVLLAATGNLHKIREIAQILGSHFRVIGLNRLSKTPRIVESGRSFDANAAIKARCVRDALRREKKPARIDFVIADDSGLRIEVLRGRPGLRSARYAGPAADDRANRRKILREMERKSNRSAVFHCSMAIAPVDTACVHFFRGCVAGSITRVERGSGGFGYDPIFVPVGRSGTFAEMSTHAKNQISHRSRALRRMKRWIWSNCPKRQLFMQKSLVSAGEIVKMYELQ